MDSEQKMPYDLILVPPWDNLQPRLRYRTQRNRYGSTSITIDFPRRPGMWEIMGTERAMGMTLSVRFKDHTEFRVIETMELLIPSLVPKFTYSYVSEDIVHVSITFDPRVTHIITDIMSRQV